MNELRIEQWGDDFWFVYGPDRSFLGTVKEVGPRRRYVAIPKGADSALSEKHRTKPAAAQTLVVKT